MRGGTVMISAGGRQPGFEEFQPAGVAAGHVIDLGVGHGGLRGKVWPLPRPDREVDRQGVADPGNALHDTVIRGPYQEDLAELGEHLEGIVVAVGLLDPG